jgi:hypothetical protein
MARTNSVLRPKSKFWRIVIPNLIQYQNSSPDRLKQLKFQILQRLLAKETKMTLQYYRIAIQHHQNGVPHLDILLAYHTSKLRRLTDWDYLLKHGDVTPYRQLNKAIIQYGTKEDKQSLSNFPQDTSGILHLQQLTKDPFAYLYARMKEDPLHFNLQQYCHQHQLFTHIKGWSSIKTKLKDAQLAAANFALKSRSGIRHIDRRLIQQRLSPAQLTTYDGWQGYQVIVDHLNQMSQYGYRRPLKTSNLLITGSPDTGKTSLFQSDLARSHVSVQDYASVYPMGTRTWWPNYQSEVFQLIFWNEAKLTSYSYDVILKVLEGSKVDLPYKGGHTLKYDNPLVIMTSNMTLDQLITQKFPHDEVFQDLARCNLAVRIRCVTIPPTNTLFLLQRLILPAS